MNFSFENISIILSVKRKEKRTAISEKNCNFHPNRTYLTEHYFRNTKFKLNKSKKTHLVWNVTEFLYLSIYFIILAYLQFFGDKKKNTCVNI